MKRNVIILSTVIAISSTAVVADTCDSITNINALYRSVAEKKATDIQIKRLQQEVGVVADGKWGRMSEAAYTALLKRCDSYSYPTDVVQIGNATITDFERKKTVFEQLTVPVCTNQRLPIYRQVQAPKDPGAVIGGAIAGGVLGKIMTDNDGGAAVGALIGGAIANENQQNNTVTKITGYENKTVCKDGYVDMPAKTEKSYAYSTIQFEVDGVSYTLEFKKR